MGVTRRRLLRALGLAAPLVLAMSGPSAAQLNILNGRPLNTRGDAPPFAAGPESIVTVYSQIVPGPGGRGASLSVTADIAPPWHTYSTTQKPVQATPTEITVDKSPDYRLDGEFRPNLPPEIDQKEGATFEIHKGSVTWQAPLEIGPGVDVKSLKVTGHARIQVCSNVCLQPTRFDFTAEVDPKQIASNQQPAATGVYAPKDKHVEAKLRGRLEPASVEPGGTTQLILTAEPTAGWHVYGLADNDKEAVGFKPTLIALTKTSGLRAERPTASEKPVEAPALLPDAQPLRFYNKTVTWSTVISIPKGTKPGEYPIEGFVGYQTCRDTECKAPIAARFEGLITVGTAGKKGAPLAFFDAKYGEAAKAAAEHPFPKSIESAAASDLSLIVVIGFSLVGGFLLNFMPCVLPVIGLKILSFAEQAGRSRAHVLTLNLWYSLGLLSVFLVLATLASAVNLGLRDTNLGWGEQFSSTSFNITMVAVVFVMALSFLGVWEIPIPGFVGSSKANDVALREGATGAFAKGVLTTVLATPCTGPLLSSVFGYTLNQPPLVTYLIFSCVGLGMASPYLAVGAFPQLIRFLPKPGAWMDTFKHMMGFVMLGTIVFLFSFMDRNYLVATFAMMVGLWAGCWWIGRTSLVEPLPRRLMAWTQGGLFAALIGLSAFTWLTPHASIIPWKAFSPAELARLNGEGQTVMVDFTAEWCANCKFNLYHSIETKEVLDLLNQNKVVPLLADWTTGSPEIKQSLESLKRGGIPLLAIFPAGKPPILLDALISKQQVLDALRQAGPSNPIDGEADGKSLTASTAPR